jgi:hypothetical protein
VELGVAPGVEHIPVAALRPPGSPTGLIDVADPGTVNRARLLFSLCQQVALHDGAVIDELVEAVVGAHAVDLDFDVDVAAFGQQPALRALFEQLDRPVRSAAAVSNHLRRSLAGIRLLRDEQVPLRDGSYLVADIFTPHVPGKYPVIMRMGVYGKAFGLGSIYDADDLEAAEQREQAWFEGRRDGVRLMARHAENGVSPDSATWVPRGYVIIRVDARGVGNSPGTLAPFSEQESLDYYDAIEWAATQSWSDGQIGLYGTSYNASIQWNVAALHPPALKAIAPLASDADAYREIAYPGGLLFRDYRRFWWDELVGNARARDGKRVDFIGGLEEHPWDDDHYHGAGLLSARFDQIEVPVLTAVSQTAMLHGRAGFEAFRDLQVPDKQLLVLDANYFPYVYEDCRPDVEAFFDRHLKGLASDADASRVRMVMRTGHGEFEWRDESDWPVPGTTYRELFLDAGNGASPGTMRDEPRSPIQVVEYSADALASPVLPMAVFDTAPFEQTVELAGHFRSTLWVSSSSTDADLFVALRVLDGDEEVPYPTRDPGSQAPLTWGCLRVSHRALDPERSTAERPWHPHRREDAMRLVPDEVAKIEIELLPATARIAAGHRLRLEVSPAEGRGAPPGWSRGYDETYHRGAVNRIFTGGSLGSSLVVPVVPATVSAR